MSTDDDAPLVRSAARATQRAADAAVIEAALDEVHAHIFGDGASADVSPSAVLSSISAARALLDKSETAKRSDLDTVRLLLEAVLTLGEMLASAADGCKVRSRTIKRLEDVVLPILFLRSSVTAQLLRAHTLKSPWAVFQSAGRSSSKEMEKLELAFASWRADHGWDFSLPKERGHVASAPPASAPVAAKTSAEHKETERAGSAPEHQRAVLRDISWNTALKRSAGAGIPSYLLSKRRHIGGDSSGVWCPPSPGVSCPGTALPHNPHTTIDKPDATTGARILALESPVKRRRIDLTLGIPPSPDRPGRRL